jgi:hypothetical protein
MFSLFSHPSGSKDVFGIDFFIHDSDMHEIAADTVEREVRKNSALST